MNTWGIRLVRLSVIGLLCVSAAACACSDDGINTVNGVSNAVPPGYVPPLVSNGSLCLQVDQTGGQLQQAYVNMVPTIFWAGRRYDPPASRLIPFGHFAWRLEADGQPCPVPATWSQTLDTRAGVVNCRNRFAQGVEAETTIFTPLGRDLIVLQRRYRSADGKPHRVRATFAYAFSEPRKSEGFPWRVTGTSVGDESARCARITYRADGYPASSGIVTLAADTPVTAKADGARVELAFEGSVNEDQPLVQTVYLIFADSLDGKDVEAREQKTRTEVLALGYGALLAEQRAAWAAYWERSFVRLPDAALMRMYTTAQYHLRANATRWSFPVGLFNTHWSGRYFGWDEMFCYQAIVSSNRPELARRCPEFRFKGLKKALYRKAHYGRPGLFGAHYPWEALEDGAEGAPPYGFWADHIFHMSNIALSAWYHYLYTEDADYLSKVGYPVIKECARFFLANMIYEWPDGSMIIGKCTDLERLGTSRLNPFLTSCGAIYTLESAAAGAELLKLDSDEAASWRHAALKLRESLPRENGRYVPYKGCAEESVASLGGLFPYPLFDETSELQRNAVYHFVQHGRAFGNMYQMGTSVCAWYLGWMAAALAELGDTVEPARMLREAADGAGCFGEMFEINEEKVRRCPWFSTASGNVVYALNQMLVQNREGRILLARGVPAAWRDYAFKLACHGDLVVETEVKDGRLARLALLPGDPSREQRRTVMLPASLTEQVAFDTASVLNVTRQDRSVRLEVLVKGPVELVQR